MAHQVSDGRLAVSLLYLFDERACVQTSINAASTHFYRVRYAVAILVLVIWRRWSKEAAKYVTLLS